MRLTGRPALAAIAAVTVFGGQLTTAGIAAAQVPTGPQAVQVPGGTAAARLDVYPSEQTITHSTS